MAGEGRTFAQRCSEDLVASCLNVLTTKQSYSRQNILNGSFCQAASLKRTAVTKPP